MHYICACVRGCFCVGRGRGWGPPHPHPLFLAQQYYYNWRGGLCEACGGLWYGLEVTAVALVLWLQVPGLARVSMVSRFHRDPGIYRDYPGIKSQSRYFIVKNIPVYPGIRYYSTVLQYYYSTVLQYCRFQRKAPGQIPLLFDDAGIQ